MSIEADTEFRETQIESVQSHDGGGWSITNTDGWSFFVPPESPVTPTAGAKVRFYGRGLGYIVRGLTIDGVAAFYRTEAEEDARHRQQCLDEKLRKAAEYEAKRGEYASRIAAPPRILRRRIKSFRRMPGFRYELEPYELFVCEQAVAFAAALKTPEAIRDFHGKSCEEQRALVPAMDDGHSGNTFGMAVRLAHLLVTQPKAIRREHGALVGLVGCAPYGCHT